MGAGFQRRHLIPPSHREQAARDAAAEGGGPWVRGLGEGEEGQGRGSSWGKRYLTKGTEKS